MIRMKMSKLQSFSYILYMGTGNPLKQSQTNPVRFWFVCMQWCDIYSHTYLPWYIYRDLVEFGQVWNVLRGLLLNSDSRSCNAPNENGHHSRDWTKCSIAHTHKWKIALFTQSFKPHPHSACWFFFIVLANLQIEKIPVQTLPWYSQ